MRRGFVQIALWLALGIALVASVVVIVRQSRRLTALRQQHTADLKSLSELRETLRQRDLQQFAGAAAGPAPMGDYQAQLARHEATIKQLNHELAEAHADIARLQTQLSNSSQESAEALAGANARHQKEQEDLQSQVDSLKQDLDSSQAQLDASRQRISHLEADNAKLKSDNGNADVRATQTGRTLASLQDLDRRRDVYLTSILRRYREITSQFQAMGGMLGSSRDSNQNSGALSEASLTRIQNAVSQTDDDIRQLNDLNAQIHQLEKKLASTR